MIISHKQVEYPWAELAFTSRPVGDICQPAISLASCDRLDEASSFAFARRAQVPKQRVCWWSRRSCSYADGHFLQRIW